MCWRKIDDCGFFITMAHSSMPTDNGWRVSALIKIKGVIHFCLFRFRSLTLSLSHTHFFRFPLINPNPRMGLHMKLGSPMKRGANPIKYHSRPRHAWLTHEMVLSLFISTWHYFPFAFIFFCSPCSVRTQVNTAKKLATVNGNSFRFFFDGVSIKISSSSWTEPNRTHGINVKVARFHKKMSRFSIQIPPKFVQFNVQCIKMRY